MIRRWLERRRFARDHRWTGPRLSAYLDRELSDRDRRRLEAHTRICPECGPMLATLRRTLEGLRDLGRYPSPPRDLTESVIERLRSQT